MDSAVSHVVEKQVLAGIDVGNDGVVRYTLVARSTVDGRSRIVRRPAFATVDAWVASLLAKAERVKEAFELPAEKWVKVLRRLEVEWVDAPEDEQA